MRVASKAVWSALLLLLVLVTPAAASSGSKHHPKGDAKNHRKVDAFVAAHLGSSDSLRVIITTRPKAREDVKRHLVAHGRRVVADHPLVSAITADLTADDVQKLERDSDVEAISIDGDVAPSSSTSYTDTSVVSEVKQELGIANWFTGSSLTIAMIDSGIAANSDFIGRILGTYDFTNSRGGISIAASDEYGHGTHVAGLVGASGALSSGVYAGVVPGVKFVSLKVLNNKGGGKTSDVISALQFAVANKDRFGIRIINLSLGHPIYESATTDPLVQAVEAAVRAGIVVVVAGGNYGTNPSTGLTGYGGITSPGNSPSALTVGASTTAHTVTRVDDRVAAYSSRGPSWFDGYAKPDVVAPGQDLISDEVDGSTLATTYPWLVVQGSNGKFLRLSGSSMSTGVVSGLVATMIEAHDYAAYQRYQSSGRLKKLAPYVPPPALTPNAIKAMLQYSATPLRDANGVRYDALTQGTGEVDGLGALTLAYYADTSKTAGSWWLTGTVTPVTQFGDDYETWAQQIVWGTREMSGGSLVQVDQPAWQLSTVWGAGELDDIAWCTVDGGDNIVWGTSLALPDVVWAGSVDSGDNIVWGTTSWAQNIVWGTDLVGYVDNGDNIVWGTSVDDGDNIVWGTLENLDLVWGSSTRVIVLGGGQ